MSHDLLTPVKALLESFSEASPIVVAVSGGRDSMALGDVAVECLQRSRLIVGHFNHALRGAESDGDEAFVREFFGRRSIRVETMRGSGVTSEADLRKERRAFLRSLCGDSGKIFTAHHLEDQVETFFLRLLRGTGSDGMTGMSEVQGKFLKPWLTIPRAGIEAYVRDRQLPFREDATNAQPIYLRNRVRHELLPRIYELARDFGGESSFNTRLAALMDECREETEFLETAMVDRFSPHVVETGYWIRVPREAILSLSSPLKQRALRYVVKRLGLESLSRVETKSLLGDLQKGRRETPISGGGRVLISCAQFFFQNPAQRAKSEISPSFRFAGDRVEVPDIGMSLHVDHIPPETELRFFREGDRQNGKKLKHLWLEERVPAAERRLVPLLARRDSQEVLWRFPEKHAVLQLESLSFPFSFLA